MKTEITTKQSLINLINQIDDKIENLLTKINTQQQTIKELESQNEHLKRNNQKTLDQIKEYIRELEQIRAHYVNSHDNDK